MKRNGSGRLAVGSWQLAVGELGIEFISWGRGLTGDFKYELALTLNKNVAMFLAMRLCFYQRWVKDQG